MGDERGSADESEKLAGTAAEPAPSVSTQMAPTAAPRPVSLPPRPGVTPLSPSARPPGTPPPPPIRNLPPLTPQATDARTPPFRSPSAPPLPPSMRPPAPSARPPLPPSVRPAGSTPPPSTTGHSALRGDNGRVQELLAELMRTRKELSETATELRKVVSERNALRIRVVQAENSARELASASRAEAQLRSEFVDAHAASSAALRARISELEAALAAALAAHAAPPIVAPPSLRQIRGIGPAFERALLGLGITTVSQIAALDASEIERIAPLIKVRSDRILRDDWVGQAKQLLGEQATP